MENAIMQIETRALRLLARGDTPESLPLDIARGALSAPPPGHAIVEVRAAAINPSDVKAAMGMMPYAVWPRTPGRDYAGKVVAGPGEWLGVEVWGTGGDLRITRDGTHASHLVLPVAALVRKPDAMPMASAATAGVPFVTAHEGWRRAGLRGPGQTVLVLGAHGKVGQAAIQLASRLGASVIGVERHAGRYEGHASGSVELLDGTRPDLAARILALTDGQGVDIAYNTVGSPYFAATLEALRTGGSQILISSPERVVPFDIMAFYRRNLQMLGVDSLKLDASRSAGVLRELLPDFESGALRAFPVEEACVLPLERAVEAYRRTLDGSPQRLVLAA